MTPINVAASAWLRSFHPGTPTGVRLVCFPHAGGAATAYFPISAALAGRAEVLAVQYPGRQDRRTEPPMERISGLAAELAEILAPLDDRPAAFFGHSMGAIIAYETALLLEARGQAITHLFASGRRAPSRYRPENVHQRGEADILREVRLLSGTSTTLLDDPETVQMIMPALRADYRAIETYRHDPSRHLRHTPITALVGDADPRTSLDEARDWRAHTEGAFDLQVFPGDHFYLTGQPGPVAEAVAARLS
ncbi:alpha/beta fold hydrolase [Actinoplanes sp. NPDC023936]|uniref:thioesterase II family protein n=1 Tax=Actinoplanes sp. NPDC023936 TaxID=3154910 RepID=UPI0033E3883D